MEEAGDFKLVDQSVELSRIDARAEPTGMRLDDEFTDWPWVTGGAKAAPNDVVERLLERALPLVRQLLELCRDIRFEGDDCAHGDIVMRAVTGVKISTSPDSALARRCQAD